MNTLALLLGAAFTTWWVDPYGDVPYLPDAEPHGGVVTNVLSCAAAKGEIETISFSVQPSRDLKKVDFRPSDLTGPGGAKIPAACADFALVKCWYRAGGRWRTSWCGNHGKPELINDLVLHDNDLIRVVEDEDYAKRTVLVRFSYPEGPVWVDMRKHGNGSDHFLHEVYPVMDAKKFVPFDLQKDRFQQYWFTWKIPQDAKPGVYRGTLDVYEEKSALAKLSVEIEVYPFALPTARTHYDTSKRFISSWMGTPSLEGELSNSKNLAVSEAKLRNVYKSFAEHNAHEANGPGHIRSDSTDDLGVRTLILMRQAGMDCEMTINGMSCDPGWACPVESPFISPEQDPQLYSNVLARYCKMLDLHRLVYDKYLGHHNNYWCGPDECGTYQHRRDYGFFGEIFKRGMFTWADSGVPQDVGWSITMNDAPAAARHTTAWNWHKGSAEIVTYAGTFTGPSDPDIWRRTKGLRYYYADFNGLHEYCWCYNRWNHWNDFKYRGSYAQFQIGYPTYDGFIATLAWEGVREALDDVRYLSLLRLRAQAAMKSSDPKVRALGKRHYVWMDSQEPEYVIDLFAFRREVARRAAELVKFVGEEPVWKPAKPAPELPPCSYGSVVPTDVKPDKLAAEYERNNRYDLAIPVWEKVFADEGRPVKERCEAASRLAKLQTYFLQRDAAIRTLDTAIGWRETPQGRRGKLLLQKSRTMLSDKVFEEEFTLDQLNAAATVLNSAFAMSGTTQRERFESILSMVDAYLAGGQPQAAIDYAEARLQDTKLSGPDKTALYIRKASGYIAMSDWDAAARVYRFAHQEGGRIGREVLKSEGWVAEQREDWKTAQSCYGAESKMYGSEEEDLKAGCVARCARVTKKLREKERDVVLDAEDIINGTIDIELDE